MKKKHQCQELLCLWAFFGGGIKVLLIHSGKYNDKIYTLLGNLIRAEDVNK